MNKVIITVYVLMVDEEKQQAFCRIGQSKQPLCCECKTEQLRLLKPGKNVVLEAELRSRDVVYRNPCECNTTCSGVESYLSVSDVLLDREYCNEVVLDHVMAVKDGQIVQASEKSFQTVRVRLPGDSGYATVSVPDKKMIHAGTAFAVGGCIMAKDFEKYTVCPCCGLEKPRPQLSLLVRGSIIQSNS